MILRRLLGTHYKDLRGFETPTVPRATKPIKILVLVLGDISKMPDTRVLIFTASFLQTVKYCDRHKLVKMQSYLLSNCICDHLLNTNYDF